VAIGEASLVLFLVSARDGLTTEDESVATSLRQKGCTILLVANKIDGTDPDVALADFAILGLGEAVPVAAVHRRGLERLMSCVSEILPEPAEPPVEEDLDRRRVAIIGRPNVGKSTLVNRLLGEERVMAYDLPGTTRDSIRLEMERKGICYELIDTAGVRRRARIDDTVEKFSVIKALQAIERAHVVVLMLDASEGLTDQDTTLLGHILQQGRALVFALNKWDGLTPEQRDTMLSEMDRKLQYVDWARRVRLSALRGSGIGELMKAVNEAWESAMIDLPTPELTRVLRDAVEAHQPAMSRGRAIRLRYAHSGGKFPPRVIIHGNRTDRIQPAYKRYLENTFIRHFRLRGTPMWIQFREGDNPYKDRKNPLTDRQKAKRKRLKKFTSRKKSR
jgi:GTP-binding protein